MSTDAKIVLAAILVGATGAGIIAGAVIGDDRATWMCVFGFIASLVALGTVWGDDG